MKAVVRNMLDRIRARGGGSLEGRYADFAAASRACADPGYEAANVVEVVARKTARLRAAAPDGKLSAAEVHVLLAITCAAQAGRPVRILDFGGACGGHFLRARGFFGDRLRLRWAVVETPAMVRAAGGLGLDENISFHSGLDDALAALGAADLVLCSGALQYVPDLPDTLDSLITAGAPVVCIARLPLADSGGGFFCLQHTRLSSNGPGPLPEGIMDTSLRYPMAVIDAAQVEQRLRKSAMSWSVIPEEGLLHHPAAGFIRFATYLGRT